MKLKNNICVCPEGKYTDSQYQCKGICHQSCLTCNGKEKNNCTFCRSGNTENNLCV